MTDLSSTPPSGPVALLPVVRTVTDAYQFTLQRIGQVVTAAIVPFALSMLVALIDAGLGETPFAFVTLLVDLFAYAIFAVAWHRALLVNEPPSLLPRLGDRQLRFWLMTLLITLIVAGVVVLPAFLFGLLAAGPSGSPMALLALPLALSCVYLLARFSFVFPAAAVDERFGLGASWRTTAGNAWRLIGAYLLAVLPMMVVMLGLLAVGGGLLGVGGSLGGSGVGGALGVLMIVTLSVVNYIFAAVFVSLLSLSFRTCTGWIADSGQTPPGSSPTAELPRNDDSGDAGYH
ncbi:hypothetical protein [Algihabitans albus]|uniref:hypothetical protein n=1 Tax=Algihabitans albus TaxID=2164067 RepID=UPI000E5D1F8F|nr:hypothetical protein [Algihabitans albus]